MPEIFHPVEHFGLVKFHPTRFEADVFECQVEGEIPKELEGAFIRVSGERQFPTLENDIIINGDGLFSAFYFENGHVSFKSRYVMTDRLKAERAARRRLFGIYRNKYTDEPSVMNMPQRDNTANTTAFAHHGELYALREDCHPYKIDPLTLETLGVGEFPGLESKTISAHPKIDPDTGEWWSYGVFAKGEPTTDMSLHVFDKNGKLTREEWFKSPIAGACHDWCITENHLIFPVLNLTADPERIRAGGQYYQYEPGTPGKWGIMPKHGSVEDMRWFDVKEAVIGHIMNAYSDGDKVIVDTPLSTGNGFSFFSDKDGNYPGADEVEVQIARLVFDLSKPGSVEASREKMAGAYGEMPRVDERFIGKKYRYGYFAARNFVEMSKGIMKVGVGQIDWQTGEVKEYNPHATFCHEPVFIPKSPDADEGDGYILSACDRMQENRSDLLILDGNDISRGPIATVKLPFPQSPPFHGCWMPAAELKR